MKVPPSLLERSAPCASVIVAVPTLLAGDALRECLESLTNQRYRDFQIVVVDNSGRGLVSQQGDAKRAGALVLEMPRNVGFGAAVNAAWQCCRSAHLATLNDDAVASPDWLAQLMAGLVQFETAGMLASCVMLAGSGTLDSAGMLLCADGSSKQRGFGEPMERFSAAEDVLLPSASAALYRAEALRETGAFDPDFFLYCEDTDLGLRIRRAGWGCRYVPGARVAHRYSHSAGRASALKAYYVERNRLFLAVKNFPLSTLICVPFVTAARYAWHLVYLFRGTGAAAQFTAQQGAAWQLPWLVLKAHLAVLGHLPRLLRQRVAIGVSAKISDLQFSQLLRRHSLRPREIARY